ncbi:germination protease precursor [Peptococcaceae bacterium CEB3]|nr:germination protease precursor [Peptococcaceae bacterium CEB3]
MKKSELYRRLAVNLDLALEAHEILRGETGTEVPGVRMDEERYEHCNVTTITIETDEGVQEMNKPKGRYVTMEAPEIRDNNHDTQREITQVLAGKLTELMGIGEDAGVLLVGLGNWNATPDALGPKVINKSLVTRHLFKQSPDELKGKLREVSAIAPGVLGLTGIETAEIIRGIVEHVKPDLVIAVDALAAGSLERIGTSIQLADTGIHPGSGVGNHRAGINEESIGCKVLAIGLPTVVNAAVISGNTLDVLLDELKTSPTLYKIYKGLNPQFMQNIMEKVLSPYQGTLMVTPKEIDSLIDVTARIIAGALGLSLHPGIDPEDYENYLQ